MTIGVATLHLIIRVISLGISLSTACLSRPPIPTTGHLSQEGAEISAKMPRLLRYMMDTTGPFPTSLSLSPSQLIIEVPCTIKSPQLASWGVTNRPEVYERLLFRCILTIDSCSQGRRRTSPAEQIGYLRIHPGPGYMSARQLDARESC